ncbi:MAG: autotransporter-associated beta strand repeat-containing protein [Rhodospirillaceae bacterium]|nr:autotransporter-associated beta strand repeat-containing protein [Rhodospirillaceae bacterium]
MRLTGDVTANHVLKTGAGVLQLGDGAFLGGLDITQGPVEFASGNLVLGNLQFRDGTIVRAIEDTTFGTFLMALDGSATIDVGAGLTANSPGQRINGAGTLSKTGAGTLDLKMIQAGTFTGAFDVSDGTLRTNAVTVGNSTISNSGTLAFDQEIDGTYGGVLIGTGALEKTGVGKLTMSGANFLSGGTTVLAGTLAGTTATIRGAIANAGTVMIDQDADGAFSGAISGAGSFVKDGTGLVFMSAGNTYTGGTEVRGGTLWIGNNSIQGPIDNDATVLFFGGGSFAGAMSGSGAFIKEGGDTLTLSGINSYTGGTEVRGGALRGNTFTVQGNILNQGSVEFDQTFLGTYSGAMSGSGGLVKSGTGIVTLTGANTYTGGTVVLGGRLQGTAQGIQGDIDNRATVLIGNFTDESYAGRMSGTGSFIKNGPNTLTLLGNNTYTGTTEIRQGTLALAGGGTVDGTVLLDVGEDGMFDASGKAAGYVFRNTVRNKGAIVGGDGPNVFEMSGEVSGDGAFLGNVLFSGTYRPGNSPALVTHGNTVFGTTNVLAMEIGGTTRGLQYDAIDAITLGLGGTLSISLIDLLGGGNPFAPQAGDVFDLLMAQTITGMFATFDFAGAALAQGLEWSWNVLKIDGLDTFRLMVVNAAVADVPAPGALLIVCLGLTLLAVVSRRRIIDRS